MANHTFKVAIIHGDLNKPFPMYPNRDWQSNDNGVISGLNEALAQIEGYQFTVLANHDTLLNDLKAIKNEVDIIFQLCDDGYMNDPNMAAHVCALLDVLGLPYTGSGLKAMMMTSDKQIELDIAQRNGIPVPESILVQPWEPLPTAIKFPAIVKPNATDGSFGLTRKNVVHNFSELQAAVQIIREEFRLACPILIQKYLSGRDIFVSILGNAPDNFQVLEITEEDYSALPADYPKICGYESKWDPASPYWYLKSRLTTLPAAKKDFIIAGCKKLYTRLEIQDYARFDWRLDENDEPYFLEANPNCGWCFDSHLVKTAALSGLSYSQLLKTILEYGLRRYGKL